MALADILARLGEDEETQEQKLAEILTASTESAARITALETSVEKTTTKNAELLAEKKKLARAKTLLIENGIDPEDENAEALLKAKLAVKSGEPASESSMELIELRSNFNKVNSAVAALTERAEKAEKDKAELEAKKNQADIKQAVIDGLGSASVGVCLSASRLFQLNQGAFVKAGDGETVLWNDNGDLKTIEDFAAASHSNPDDAIFWAGRGQSGSGTAPGRPGLPEPSAGSKGNVFAVDGNATEASRMWNKDRKGAERLIAMARQKGNLAPAWARTLEMSNR